MWLGSGLVPSKTDRTYNSASRPRPASSCRRSIVLAMREKIGSLLGKMTAEAIHESVVWPQQSASRKAPVDVQPALAQIFGEAADVLSVSARASAALSRRCLQQLLRDHADVKPGQLINEIEEAIGGGGLPSALTTDLHAIRQVGNFAAHPQKNTSTSEILDVEPGEAEWLLDLLESLFDHYFVKPAQARARRAALNKRLEAAGKPPNRRSGVGRLEGRSLKFFEVPRVCDPPAVARPASSPGHGCRCSGKRPGDPRSPSSRR